MAGPIATQPAAPSATTTGRLDVRRTHGYRERPEPTLAQKSPALHDTNAADALTLAGKPAEEQSGAGAVAPAPAAAAAANVPSRNLAPRMQAAERDEALVSLDSAAVHAILGRDPSVIPGLAVRRITRSPRAADEIVVEQTLDSAHVITLWERPVVPASRDAAATATRGATDAKAAPDYVGIGRNITGVWVQIQGGVAADSLKKLLGKIKP